METFKTKINAEATSFERSLIEPGDLVFDVGANLGAKTERFLESGARVVCVEPQPGCANILRQKFAGNPNVVVVEKGLAEKRGLRELSICSTANTISTFSEEWKQGRFANYSWDSKVVVEMSTLDELISIYGIPKYCKIDVEGFEISVLKGLSKKIPHVSFEFTIEFIDNARHCVECLAQLGFSRFNVILGENKELEFSDWLNHFDLFDRIAALEMPQLWGDIHAQADCLDSAPSIASHGAKARARPDGAGILNDFIRLNLWQPAAPLRLHLGCGEQHFPGYVNIDYPPSGHNVMNVRADFFADTTKLDFPAASVDEVRLHHVFEHFSRVTAMAMLIRWHNWLKLGGSLRIETPDILGCSKTLTSDAPLRVKMGIIRHIAGDQAASWAYHLDHWFPERYEQTLQTLGFEVLEVRRSSWPREPFLSNVEIVALKRAEISLDQQLKNADELLWQSTVADVEKPTWEIWRQQLRSFFSPEAPEDVKGFLPPPQLPDKTPPAVAKTPPTAAIANPLGSIEELLAPLSSTLPLAKIHHFNQSDRDEWVRRKALETPAGLRVLDVGAGTCPYRTFFQHCEYRAHDFKKYEGVKLGNTTDYGDIDYVSDVENIPVPADSFDLILCTEVLEHVPEPIEAMREMSRILKPGGRLLITAPLGSGLHQLPFHFYGGYTPEWYKYCAKKFSLEIVEIIPNGGALRLLAQECARVSWTWGQHGQLHGPNGAYIRHLFNEVLPRFLFGLEQHWFNDQFTVGYHIELKKPGLSI